MLQETILSGRVHVAAGLGASVTSTLQRLRRQIQYLLHRYASVVSGKSFEWSRCFQAKFRVLVSFTQSYGKLTVTKIRKLLERSLTPSTSESPDRASI